MDVHESTCCGRMGVVCGRDVLVILRGAPLRVSRARARLNPCASKSILSRGAVAAVAALVAVDEALEFLFSNELGGGELGDVLVDFPPLAMFVARFEDGKEYLTDLGN